MSNKQQSPRSEPPKPRQRTLRPRPHPRRRPQGNAPPSERRRMGILWIWTPTPEAPRPPKKRGWAVMIVARIAALQRLRPRAAAPLLGTDEGVWCSVIACGCLCCFGRIGGCFTGCCVKSYQMYEYLRVLYCWDTGGRGVGREGKLLINSFHFS